MMTTTPNFPQDRHPDGRTVRDIAEHSPALVGEVWCRKILRQVLQSLEAQYANGDPHRLIMPDTIIVKASGDAILMPDPDANADFQPEVAADLRALAATIHYAITLEMPASGPLTGRALVGYSDSLLGAVDRCMAPNKTQRPQTVAELRDLLGMVSVGLLKPSAGTSDAAAPAAAQSAALVHKTVDLGPPASSRKWLWIGLAAALLAGALYIVRQHGAEELVGAPVQPPKVQATVPAPAPAAPVVEPTPPAAPVDAVPEPAPESAPPAPTPVPAQSARAATDAASTYATETANSDPTAATGTATYRLMVNPWGTIYVDGKRRGVSPPLKRLMLPAGRHTVMLENPGYPDRIIQINSARGSSGQIEHDFLATPAEAAN
jgi:hypothetical protein